MPDFTLTRTSVIPNGLFGTLNGDNGFECVTLERTWNGLPKVPAGAYTCQRGMHQLFGMSEPFECFEVMDVPGHTGILFHVANYPSDLEGCIGLGEVCGQNMICNSRDAFSSFMESLAGVDSFQLTVA